MLFRKAEMSEAEADRQLKNRGRKQNGICDTFNVGSGSQCMDSCQ